MSTAKSGRRPAKFDPGQAAWPQECGPDDEKETAASAAQVETGKEVEAHGRRSEAEALTADPWAIEKVSHVAAQKICLACHGHAERGDNGVWRVNAATLEHLGYSRETAERWIAEAQQYGCNPLWEGGIVVAKMVSRVVSVRSTARRPHLSAYLALVSGMFRLRCGDEVAVFCPPSGTREVCRGR